MKDFMYIADTEDQWREFAIAQGIAQIVTLPGNEEQRLVYNPGYHADHIGRVVTTPGTYDNSVFPPVELTPPVYDERFHVNLRVVGDNVEVKDETGRRVLGLGAKTEDEIGHRIFQPTEGSGVTWVNPVEVATPQRIWLGGMQYFDPVGKLTRPGPTKQRR